MLRQNSPTAKRINKIRWNFVKPTKAKYVLDWGSGCGWFLAFKPSNVEVETYDINPWPQTGKTRKEYDLITFWDVLEHINNLDYFIPQMIKEVNPSFIAITCPALQSATVLEDWKHFKPGEHLYHFTEEEWDNLFRKNGFKKIRSGYPECPPRSDIYSALYRKSQHDTTKTNQGCLKTKNRIYKRGF